MFHIDFHERSLRRRHTADRLEEGVRTLPPRFGTVITESESGSVALGCGTGTSRRDRRCVLPFSPVLVSGIRSCRNSTSTFGSIFSEIFENSAASPRLAASPRASPLQFCFCFLEARSSTTSSAESRFFVLTKLSLVALFGSALHGVFCGHFPPGCATHDVYSISLVTFGTRPLVIRMQVLALGASFLRIFLPNFGGCSTYS